MKNRGDNSYRVVPQFSSAPSCVTVFTAGLQREQPIGRNHSMKYLYADTSIWNCLCDEGVDATALCSMLAERGIELAIGFNVFYEMAKAFFSGTTESTGRGRQLLSYMKTYLALDVPVVKENWALLIEEAFDADGQTALSSWFRDRSQYMLAVREIDKLLNGEIGAEVATFFAARKALVQTSRKEMKDLLNSRPELKALLENVSDAGLADFLDAQTVGSAGQFLLLGHLRKEFPNDSVTDLAQVAAKLLQSPKYRAAHVMTRLDLYLNWRCANRGSMRSDLPDDSFHVVSAAYCNLFVTTEQDQADLARYAIEGIKTLVYPKELDFLEWLASELDAIGAELVARTAST